MPFFSSLTYTGTRIGGQRECRTQHFEANSLSFPNDYPTTAAHDKAYKRMKISEIAKWSKKPSAKRPNWEKLGVDYPWHLNWESILGYENLREDRNLTSTQRFGAETNHEPLQSDIKPWLLRGPETRSILNEIIHSKDHSLCLRRRMESLRSSRMLRSDQNTDNSSLLNSALIMVSLDFPYRGAPESFAFICQPTEEESDAFYEDPKAFKMYLRQTERGESEELIAASEVDSDTVIGYVTTGHYSLSIGKCRAIGAISLLQLIQLMGRAQR